MTPAQCRAARALLDWTQPQLAAAAGLGLSTVVDFERSRRAVSSDAVDAIRLALERADIVFMSDVHLGVGLRAFEVEHQDTNDNREPMRPTGGAPTWRPPTD
jgi:transcriptional regulator with XRE-family HTH domain